MAIAQSFIQELLARADVVEVVGRYVQLKKSGANFMGLCPFHAEKTPSFSVSPAKQFYHCFSCGKHGDAINFLMEHTGASFTEAVHELAQQCGLSVPEDTRSPQEKARDAQQSQRRATLSQVLARASQAYRQRLKDAPRAIGYLKQRGLTGQIASRFALGYAPEGWRTLAGVFPDYADPLLVESGLVIAGEGEGGPERRYDRFRDRIMFPIRSVKGEVIGFGARVLGNEKPKYLNSPETPVFHKGSELYGLYEARAALREKGYALVVEGYMDVVALAQLGFANAVATLGTACTPQHVQKLFRFTASVVFSFDGDAAGQRAAHKALQAALPYASDTRSVKFLFLPGGHDPDSFIRTEGAQAFAAAVAAAEPLSRFLLQTAAQDCDMDSAEGRARFAAQARPLWQQLPAGALAQQILAGIAQQTHIDARELAQLWGQSRSASGASGTHARSAPSPGPGQRPWRGSAGGPDERWHDRRHDGWHDEDWPNSAARLRAAPASRASRALQIVLTDPAAWPALGEPDQHLLCSQPAPHGPLFAWLDRQFHEHGPQPWAALRQALRGHPLEAAAVREVQTLLALEGIASDRDDLQSVLRGARVEDIKRRMDAALAAGDTSAYRQLMAELGQLRGG